MRRLLLLTVLAALVAVGTVQTSLAAFTATSSNTGNLVSTAPDWTPPSVELDDPGSPLRRTITLSAAAEDEDSEIAVVRLYRSPAGAGAWTVVCAPTAAPYACLLDTETLADGLYDLRAVAVDVHGNEAQAFVTDRLVDNTAPTVTVHDPGSPLSGTITVSASAADAHAGVASVTIQHQAPGGAGWATICVVTDAPYTCAWDTPQVPDGEHALRAIAVDGAGNDATSAVVSPVTVRNHAGRITYVGATSNRTEASTLALGRPTGVQPGDVLVAQVTIENGTSQLVNPAGWTVINSVNQSSNLGMRTYWRVAGPSEPASYSIGTSGKKASGGIVAYAGADPSAPVVVSATGANSDGTMSAPSVTSGAGNARLIALFGSKEKGAVHTVPAGMTNLWTTPAFDFRSSAHDRELTTAGSYGPLSSGSAAGDPWVAQTIVLRPR